jgi:hypothetical protein
MSNFKTASRPGLPNYHCLLHGDSILVEGLASPLAAYTIDSSHPANGDESTCLGNDGWARQQLRHATPSSHLRFTPASSACVCLDDWRRTVLGRVNLLDPPHRLRLKLE